MNELDYKITLRLFKEEKFFGPGVAELLTLVKETKSLRQAAFTMDMAYSKAWKIIRNSEDILGYKLLNTTTGGKGGGSAELTPEAVVLLENYQRFLTGLQEYGDKLFDEIFIN